LFQFCLDCGFGRPDTDADANSNSTAVSNANSPAVSVSNADSKSKPYSNSYSDSHPNSNSSSNTLAESDSNAGPQRLFRVAQWERFQQRLSIGSLGDHPARRRFGASRRYRERSRRDIQ